MRKPRKQLLDREGAPIVELDTRGRRLFVRSVDFAKGTTFAPHRHRYGQLIYAISGLLIVRTSGGTWIVPSLRGVWVPPEAEHSVDVLTPTQMRSAYVDARIAKFIGNTCRLVNISSLLRELIMHIGEPNNISSDEFDSAAASMLVSLVQHAASSPLAIPIPKNAMLRAIYSALIEDPSDQRTLAAWARQVGGSERTLLRRLKNETGMSFRHWRQQIRLLRSLELLARGDSVTTVALDVGYDTPSGFITSFRKSFGATPSSYFNN